MIHQHCFDALCKNGLECNGLDLELSELSLDKYLIQNKLDYYEATRLVMCLGIQLSALQEISKSVLFVQPKDIIRLNSDWFVLKESANISDITDSNTIRIIEPLSFLNSDNVPLELKNIKELPAYIPIGCGYYSIAQLITTAMKLSLPINTSIISGTSLHYFMERCMIKDPALRQYVFI